MAGRKLSKTRGVPAGRVALAQARSEEDADIHRLAEWFAKNGPASRPGFFFKIGELAKRREKIPDHIREEGERLGVPASDLHVAWKQYFDGRGSQEVLQPFWDFLCKRDDEACEKWLMPGDVELWKGEHPGCIPRLGEIWRWVEDRLEKADAERGARALQARTHEIASRDRDVAPPSPAECEILSAFALLREMDWSKRTKWPTVGKLKGMFGMTRQKIMAAAKAGRWGERDVWKGSGSRGKKGGRPVVRLSPRAVGKVLRAFGKMHPSLSAQAVELAGGLCALQK